MYLELVGDNPQSVWGRKAGIQKAPELWTVPGAGGPGEGQVSARRSNQSILKEINPGCSLEGLMLKLKLRYCGHLMQRVDSLEKTLMLGGIGGKRRRG